ncbi:TPR-like protein [Imleria badia]|nr:TPR-like protein [Imleria badia]
MQRHAIDITPHGHPHLPTLLSGFGSSLKARFERLGEFSDLEDAISRHRDADDLTPRGHPDKPGRLNNLGTCFLIRFEHLRELSDLEDAISGHRDAVDLTPHGHPDMPSRLHNLSNSCFARFQRFTDLGDLQDGISMLRNAVNLTPRGHSGKPRRLNTLGNSFLTRFEHLGELSDLEDAISSHRDAADLTSHGHPRRPGHLNNLGRSILARFNRLGDLSDLEDAISMLREAVDLTPHDHPDKPSRLNNLGHSFFTRFERLGELSDLEDAILRHKNAVDLISHSHPDKPAHLNNLGNSFFTRFSRLGELSDLERAISMLTDAVALTPHGHPDMPGNLNNLGNSFTARFERLGELSDLEEAISILGRAVELAPRGHTHLPTFLNSLGSAFRIRFKCLGELSDMENAILRHGDAVDLTPRGHPDRSSHLNHLGNSFIARFECLGAPSDLEQAIFLYSQAVSTPIGPISHRFHASQKWISCARHTRHHSLLRAYSAAIDLFPQLAWIGLPLTDRYYELTRDGDVVREAAAAALDSGLPEIAVEWLEQGRSIVWGELFQLRSSFEELSSSHPDHARRLRELSIALEHAKTQSAAHRPTESLKQVADRHRALAIRRDKLLDEIRGFSGFEQFLLRKQFSQLRASAHCGPVVILNAAESHCDALIVLADVDHVIHVSLPNFTFQRSAGLQNMLETLLGDARVVRTDEREGGRATLRGVSWESLLSTLWNGVVKPVLDALAFSVRDTPGELCRIFWCPTGPFVFLPIHAAGLYGIQNSEPGHKVSDFVVSSYVPTLSILSLSPNSRMVPSGDLRLLAVAQPPSDGLPPLPGVDTELDHIRAVIRHSPLACTTLLESSVGTVEEVLSLMKKADWVHFACHGIQDGVNSGLCLADRRRLKLRDIIALSRPRGGLAFLSACQTAMGEERLSDEAIHIAAGMLFAGYGGVVGTMWSISDKLAPDVARDVYGQLFRNGTRPDYRDAARALHEAIGRVRESGTVPFHIWLPFIHVGL